MKYSRNEVVKKFLVESPNSHLLGFSAKELIALEGMASGWTFKQISVPLRCDEHRAKIIIEKAYRRVQRVIVDEWMDG